MYVRYEAIVRRIPPVNACAILSVPERVHISLSSPGQVEPIFIIIVVTNYIIRLELKSSLDYLHGRNRYVWIFLRPRGETHNEELRANNSYATHVRCIPSSYLYDDTKCRLSTLFHLFLCVIYLTSLRDIARVVPASLYISLDRDLSLYAYIPLRRYSQNRNYCYNSPLINAISF